MILIDCPPTLGILTVNGLSAARDVLIPAKTDLLSIMGVPLLLDTIENIRRRANPELRILGVLPTLYHPRNTHDKVRIRRATVEHPFGTLKAWMGATHFKTRTLEKVRTEMSLHVLAYNLKRMIAILGPQPLMAAIRV